MSKYGRMSKGPKALSVKTFSDKAPAAIQNYDTRKEFKENEAIIQKGEIKIWIAIAIAAVALIVTIAMSPLIYR